MSHDTSDRLERDAWLEAQGVRVMRIATSELPRGIEDAADAIVSTAAAMIEGEDSIAAVATGPLHRASRGPPPPLCG
jgi:hypothetical protein